MELVAAGRLGLAFGQKERRTLAGAPSWGRQRRGRAVGAPLSVALSGSSERRQAAALGGRHWRGNHRRLLGPAGLLDDPAQLDESARLELLHGVFGLAHDLGRLGGGEAIEEAQ